jgi:site-specific recombinase XerD
VTDALTAGIVRAAAREVARIRALEDRAGEYARASKADNTLRAYRNDLRDFEEWCTDHRRRSLPATPNTLTLYLTALAEAGARASTIQRRVSAISQAPQLAGHVPPPTHVWAVRATLRGIRRTLGTAPEQKAPIVTADLHRLIAATPAGTLAGRRDRALLVLGFAGGLRRSELVSLDAEDVAEIEDGLRVTLRRSKTDQEGEGRELGLPRGQHIDTCPVRTLRAWRSAGGIDSGPLFRPVTRHDQLQAGRLTPQSVALVVKRACRRADLDPAAFAGHSLRSGPATAAAAGGAPERAIMRQGGWRSEAMVRRYIRTATLFEENAAAYVGL